jgi:outer membrane protein assembly factor BamA
VLRRCFHAGFLAVLGLLLPAASAQIGAPSSSPASFHAIRNVNFDRVTALSDAQQEKIRELLQSEDAAWVGRQTPEALSSFIQNLVLSSYEDNGYWRAKVSALVTWVRGQGEQRQVDVLISALNEGAQYHLKEIRWSGVNAFPNSELLKLMPIHSQDVMSRAQVAKGLEAIRQLYSSRGYVTLTALPRLEFDDAAHGVALDIAVREDSPFRFGTLSITGLDEPASQRLQQEWRQMREQPYSQEGLHRFFSGFLQQTPSAGAAPDYRTSTIDLDTHTVDILVTFPPATQAEKREQ